MAESIVSSACENHLILRSSALLGKYSRKNSLVKMIEDEPCVLTVSADSKFNYVLHGDMLEFLRFAIKNDLKGIYNSAASSNISAREIADILGKNVTFGNFNYNTGNIVNRKASSCFPVLDKTSQEVIQQYLKERQ
jgi:dTDP-4-dehydrorhamnose reductase